MIGSLSPRSSKFLAQFLVTGLGLGHWREDLIEILDLPLAGGSLRRSISLSLILTLKDAYAEQVHTLRAKLQAIETKSFECHHTSKGTIAMDLVSKAKEYEKQLHHDAGSWASQRPMNLRESFDIVGEQDAEALLAKEKHIINPTLTLTLIGGTLST